MSTPTDEQQLRATLRRAGRVHGDGHAAKIALESAALCTSPEHVTRMACELWPEHVIVPPLMGAADVADLLEMKATNLKRLSPPLRVLQVVSGRIPVYLKSDALAAKARRDERRRAA